MTENEISPESFRPGPSQDHITVEGIQLAWKVEEGAFTFQGLPVAMMWVDSTLAGLMSGVAAMVGPERFSLALQSEGRKSVDADWLLMSRYPAFAEGFKAIAVVAAVAGWGEWQFLGDGPGDRECRFRARNNWEALYQKKLGVCWGSAMLAGKLAGYCTKRFGVNCWATQTAFIARGDSYDEFLVAPSSLIIEDEIAALLSADLATRVDLAASFTHLREVQTRLLMNQETLEQQVQQRTADLAASRDQLQTVNDQLERRVRERVAEIADRNRLLQAEIVERGNAEDRLMQANLALERTMSQLRKLGAKLARVEEQERKRMAHVLHDQLQQSLVAANFSLSALERGISDAVSRETVRTARAAVEDALQESKSLILELSPPILREDGIAPAMKWLCLRMHEKHGLEVHLEVDERADMLEEDLRQATFHAVRELLLNVVKHAGVSSASVSITAQPDSTIRIVVSDSGRGAAEAALDQSEDLEFGFGLLAVRERFEALGGGMMLDCEPEQGCRVTLTAPLADSTDSFGESPDVATAPVPASVAGQDSPVPSSRIRVLLVDDHMMLRQGLVQLLSHDPSIEIIGEAASGEVGIERARCLRPDVVLMDIGLPGINGIEATRVIRAEFPGMVVIGLSMHAESDLGDAMRAAGASAYVSKSEASEVLVATLHACCGR